MKDSIRFIDGLYFLAELVVYVAVAGWGFTRDVPTGVRWIIGVGGIAVFAVTWGLFAAPRARFPLRGPAGAAFRVAWFGLGVAAAAVVIAG